MRHRNQITFVGNSAPRRCGIATFTTDLRGAVANLPGRPATSIIAMTERGQSYDYPPSVVAEIRDHVLSDYVTAADVLNAGPAELVCLQHEFGIFGGEAGRDILELTSRLDIALVTTFHTVLEHPTQAQMQVMKTLIAQSARVIVMAEKGRSLLQSVYDAPADMIRVIPHGIPDAPFSEPDQAKARLGYDNRSVILTFGLLSPGKGIEVMIDAMPEVLKSTPNALYIILGATHPNLLRDEGETYRQGLTDRIAALGLQDSVVLLNQFVSKPTLLDYISCCDIYVTPYLNPCQMTSGTLAYSFGMGRVVVSTPYWHAQELLGDGRGILTPFGDSAATAHEIAALLTDPDRSAAIRKRAYDESRSMTWPKTAQRYLDVFAELNIASNAMAPLSPVVVRRGHEPRAVDTVSTQHFLAMCDDTGLFQHAVHSIPDRLHGYCVDDNARALLVACSLDAPGETPLAPAFANRFAAFIQHAWNPDNGRFRNFMSFDRRWLEPCGSEDSHGRTLWALGQCAIADMDVSRRRWARDLMLKALPAAIEFSSPRAWAFTLLGLEGVCRTSSASYLADHTRRLLAEQLMGRLKLAASPDWFWFEDGLSYDNARLPQALIATGRAIGNTSYVKSGLKALKWLTQMQTSSSGAFRPVGSDTFGELRQLPQRFDQQPLEACATIAASLAAWRASSDPMWRAEAKRAFAWFKGVNDLSIPLVDPETGSCRDGLHPDRANENRGGESAVSYLLALTDLRQLQREAVPLRAPSVVGPQIVAQIEALRA